MPYLYGLLLLMGGFALVVGCVDQRQDPRKAKTRDLSPREWAKVRRHFLSRPPRPRYPLNVTLAIRRGGRNIPAVHVYGVDVSPSPVKRGKDVTVTYYFKPLRNFRNTWGVFLHAEAGPNHQYYLNKDHHPIDGLYPTPRWKHNQIFRSSYTFKLPRDFPGDKLTLYSGFWRGRGRMKVTNPALSDGKNRLRLAVVPVRGRGLSRPVYVAYRINTPPTIDGKLDDPIWQKIPSTGAWTTYNNRKARFVTHARIAWDEKYLYVGIHCQDDDIWSTYTKRDDPIFKQEVVEFFVDANRNYKDYVELQVSPAGVIFDSYFPRYRWPKPWGQIKYDSGMEVKVHREGTLNNPKDQDRYYSVEFRLPLAKLGPAPNMPPKNGDEWLVNFYRFERSRRTRGEAQAWSPVTLSDKGGDFHRIRRFGTLRFSTQVLHAGKAPAVARTVTPRGVVRPKPHAHHHHHGHGHGHHHHAHAPASRPATRPTTTRRRPYGSPTLIVPHKMIPRIVQPRLYRVKRGHPQYHKNKREKKVHTLRNRNLPRVQPRTPPTTRSHK